jgi:Dna[CI] antecedent, DciA
MHSGDATRTKAGNVEAMRELLRGSLGRSLRELRDEDRLAAAWTVACGRAMAERGNVVGYEDGVVRIEVADAVWMRQMTSLSGTLKREMAKIAGVPVAGIHFELKLPASRQISESGRAG